MGSMTRRIGWAAIAAVAACVLAAGAADAFSCTPTGISGGNPGGLAIYTCSGIVEGDVLTVNVDQTEGGVDALLAQAVITVTEISNNLVVLDIDLTNDSTPAGTDGNRNRIVSFGLGIDPNATGGSISDQSATDNDRLTTFDTSTFPGFQLVEFCAASGSNCAGGGNGGLLSGEEDLFQFSLTGGYSAGGTIALSQFAFQFQGGRESYQKPGLPDEDRTPPTQIVPAPAALVLLGAGLLAFRAASRLSRFRRK
jgi:hypothetical protein